MNERIKFDNSFTINAVGNKRWWSTWSTGNPESDDTEVEEVAGAARGEKQDLSEFWNQIHLVLQGNDYSTAEFEKIDKDNEKIQNDIDKLTVEEATADDPEKMIELLNEIEALESSKVDTALTGQFYTFKHQTNDNTWELSLFTGAEALVKAKLFGYDK